MITVKKRSTTKSRRTKKQEKPCLLPTRGVLESLELAGLADYCEMCGNQKKNARLEPAFNPSGEPKTLCQDCRIGSAELLADRRVLFSHRELATTLAALRYWQRAIGVDSLPVGPREKSAYTDHFNFPGEEEDQDSCLPLSAEEIDALCEQINR